MSQKLSANDFKRDEKTSEYNEDFIKSYNDKIKDNFFKLMFNILKIYVTFTMINLFYLK